MRLFTHNLENEEWTLDSIRPSKSIRCYKFVQPAETALPSSSSSSAAPQPLAAPPVEQLALTPFPVAVDFHNVLDGGSLDGRIPQEHVRSIEQLIAAGFVPWILACIDHSGPASQSRRVALEKARRYLARQLCYPTDCPSEPTAGRVFACICERKLYNNRLQTGGKAEQLERYSTEVLVDGSASICDEVTAWGYVAYQVERQNFCHVVNNIIADNRTGILNDKLRIAQENQQQ